MILKKGMKGEAVSNLKVQLARLGYAMSEVGENKGVFGPKVDAAVRDFQKQNGLRVDGQVGDLTQGVIDLKLKALPTRPAPAPVCTQPNAHMMWLKRNVGQREVRGAGANPFITDCFQYTSLKNHKLALSDETAWCAALASAALRKNGFRDMNSAAASAYDRYGSALAKPEYGCIITIKRKNGSTSHVTFFDHLDKNGNFVCLGGNQSDSLKYSTFNKASIKSMRRIVPL